MRRFLTSPPFTIVFVGSLVGFAACGASTTSPSGSGAIINGSVTSTAPAASGPSDVTGDDSADAGITVSIVGSNVQVTVDGNNHFTLSGVPGGGDVTLRFHSGSSDSTVTVPAVQDGENITITVSITGGAASLDSDDRSSTDGALRQLEGRIDALPPVAAAGTFVIGGTIVETNGSTTFVQGGSTAAFTNLLLGMRVHVSGTPDGAKLMASRVDIQNTNTTLPVIVNGTVSSFSGTAASFQLTVDGTLVKGDSTTGFTGHSSFSDLANGKRVEIKGQPGNGFVFASSIHVN
jgi:hypothetical protein